ncbi:hypothetical protein BD560DRAFT_485859 [Blakeslea trispora]|nr:hypothetical protein BD560DRAFT_485859 [Blakeslea trispora]
MANFKEPRVIIERFAPKQSLECSACFQSFSDPVQLNHHIHSFHELSLTQASTQAQHDSLQCSYCQHQFRTSEQLQHHLRRMHNHYDPSTASNSRLAIHYANHYCAPCRILFISVKNYQHHLVKRHQLRTLPTILVRSKDFMDTPGNPQSIPNKETNQKENYCYVCQRQYLNKITFRVHVRTFHSTASNRNEPVTRRSAKSTAASRKPKAPKPVQSTPSEPVVDVQLDEYMMEALDYSHVNPDEQALEEEQAEFYRQLEQQEEPFESLLAKVEVIQTKETAPDLTDDNTCTVCHFQFSQKVNFERHLLKVHGIDIHTGKRISRPLPAPPSSSLSLTTPKTPQVLPFLPQQLRRQILSEKADQAPDINHPNNHCTILISEPICVIFII